MSDEKVDAYMPLWIGSYLADTLTFTTVQHGAYLLLLMAYWRERQALPDDDEDLAGITRMTRAEWLKVRPKLAKKFRVADGVWWHKRVEHELATAIQRKQQATGKAKRAAEARWGTSPKHAPSMQQALLGDCPTTPTTPSLSESSEPKGSAGAGAPPVDNSKPEDEAKARRKLWQDSGRWLQSNGLSAGDAKAFLNTVAKEHPATVAQAVQEAMKTEAPVDPKAWVQGIAKRLDGERSKPITVPSQAAEHTTEYLRQQAERGAGLPSAAALAALNAVRAVIA